MSTLWHGRFEGGPADELLAFTVSLALRPAAGAPTTWPAAGPTCAGLARAGHPHRRRGRRRARRPRPGRGRAARRARSRSSPTDEDIHTAIERRVTDLAGPARAPSSTPAAAATTRSPPTCGCGPSASWPTIARRRRCALQRGAARPGPRRRARLPAGLHPPAAGPAGAAGPPPAGPRLGAGPRRRPPARLPAPARRVAAGGRGAGRVVAAARPGRHRRRPGLRAPASRTASTR